MAREHTAVACFGDGGERRRRARPAILDET
jgi:hypothetical protein